MKQTLQISLPACWQSELPKDFIATARELIRTHGYSAATLSDRYSIERANEGDTVGADFWSKVSRTIGMMAH
jgi:hypothetical protein